MNVFNRVTLGALRQNKIRTAVTVTGVMLSAAMICAVTAFASSIMNYALQYATYANGDWHISLNDVELSDYDELCDSDKVKAAAYAQRLGYAEIDSENEYKPYLYVLGGKEDGLFDMLPIHLSSGRLPQSSDEIILPEHLEENGGVIYNIGDTLSVALGDRISEGEKVGQNIPCYAYDGVKNADAPKEEKIEVKQMRAYTVVGFYERPSFEEYTAPGYTALTVADSQPDDTARFDVYLKMKKAASAYSFANELVKKSDIVKFNESVLMYSGVSKYSNFTVVLCNLAIIVIALIMFGSVSLIYNAFSISVSERTRQFGLLSSIGATRRQLRKSVLFEAFAVSAVGIPLGIAAGIGGIAVTLLIIGNKFSAMLGGDFGVPLRIHVSWVSVAAAAAIALLTVLISAFIPARRATRTSAITAIRQSEDICDRKIRRGASKLTYKLFGLPGVLAVKNYRRSRKKYRATVLSLFMSVVLFVSASAFTGYLTDSVSGGFATGGYDITFSVLNGELNGKTPDELLDEICEDESITESVYFLREFTDGLVSADSLNEKALKEVLDISENTPKQLCDSTGKTDFAYSPAGILFVPDSEFERLLSENGLSRERFLNPQSPLGITVDGVVAFNATEEKYKSTEFIKEDEYEYYLPEFEKYDGWSYSDDYYDADGKHIVEYMSDDGSEKKLVPYDEAVSFRTLKSGKTIYDFPFYINREATACFNIIYPESAYKYIFTDKEELRYNYCLASDDHKASLEKLQGLLDKNGISSDAYDYAENVENERNLILIIRVFAYGFIVLISMIAAANVFNTVSTNISLRRREFAMLKSVGMTGGDFNRMMNFECLLYGSRALGLGLPVSAAITYLIYLAVSGGYETSFRLPWEAIGIAVFSVFAVVFATMLYSMSKIKRDNPIDALKNENL